MSKQRAYKETIRGKQNKEKNRCFERERERERAWNYRLVLRLRKGKKESNNFILYSNSYNWSASTNFNEFDQVYRVKFDFTSF
jgi:hypothetical protein